LKGTTTLAWEIRRTGNHWRYQYTLAANAMAPSHIIIELSDGATQGELTERSGPIDVGEIKKHKGGAQGNTDMPDDVFGIKFNMTGTDETVIVSFHSYREPIWGDYYSKDGGQPKAQIWNEGFEAVDPTAVATDGSVGDHLLVPNGIIPEPTTVALLTALAILLPRRRRG